MLEARDLELSFLRMHQRAHASHTAHASVAVIVFAAVAAAAPGLNDAHAANQTPREVIREVLAAPEFQQYRTDKIWQRRSDEDRKSRDWDFRALARLFEFLSEVFAGFVRVAVYVLLALGAFFLIRHVLRNIGRWQTAGAGSDRAPPDVLFGLDVRPEALPDNLAQVAAAAAESDPRLALSLLYRGALATLIHRDRMDFSAGDTEADCVGRVDRAASAPLGAYFRRLVRAWSEAAYAQRLANAAAIRALCAEWQIHFSAQGDAS
jgi:hypothetical protein